eukprot:345224-Amphidinium_carterae.1
MTQHDTAPPILITDRFWVLAKTDLEIAITWHNPYLIFLPCMQQHTVKCVAPSITAWCSVYLTLLGSRTASCT